MRTLFKTIYLIFSIVFLFYLALPSPDFPEPPSGVYISGEPADVETPLRRGYYTDEGREAVLIHYQNQFKRSSFLGIILPTYRLNYPPEEAQTLIRDQARSTFLEEIVHPFRESIFVNGFEPKLPQDAIRIEGKDWRQKIIVKYVPSNLFVRLGLGIATLGIIYFLILNWGATIKNIGSLGKS